jgi:diguanylate cyclase (GGDEF)-like protein/PAS domain S-box-containing protein
MNHGCGQHWIKKLSLWLHTRRWWQVLPGLLAALLAIGLLQLGIWQPLEYFTYNALFHLRGALPWSQQVVVVEIDEASLDQLGQFPWSRQCYTRLLNVLTPAEPSVVVLDLLFVEETPQDQALASAMAQQGRVVLAQSWDSKGKLLLPTPLLRAAAVATGQVFMQEDADGMVRQIVPQQKGIPALAIAAAQVHSLVYEPIALPSPTQTLWLNWVGSARQALHYSFADVMRGQISAAAFRNKIVLVGVTATSLDGLPTPFDRNSPTGGVYLHATALDNLLQHRFLQRPIERWLPLLLLLTSSGLSLSIMGLRLKEISIGWVGFCLGWAIFSCLWFCNGYWLPVVTPIAAFGLTGGIVALWEQHRTYYLLHRSEERYALALRGANGGLWDWDLQTDTLYFSPRWKSLLGWEENEIDSSPQEWFNRVHPQDMNALQQAIAAHLKGLTPHFQQDHRLLHRDGTYRWMRSRGIAVRDRQGKPYRLAGSQTDITDQRQAEAQLRRQAFYDGLTGLPNRALFLECVQQSIAQTSTHRTFAVLLLDLDRFKVINNSLGNALGDQLLIATAQRLQLCLTKRDVLARLGSDEFAILLNQIRGLDEALSVVHRIQTTLAAPLLLDGHEVFSSVSMGIALHSPYYSQPEYLLRDADTAMYRAKALGRAKHQVFDATMHTRMLSMLRLENDLRRAIQAIDSQELKLHYQPIVSLTTGQILGFEALVRWQHPEKGWLPPTKFISMAEETGLIIPLGWWVFQEACRQMRAWQMQFPHQSPLTMSVNLSSKQFSLPDLIPKIQQVFAETGLDASAIKLEITESTIMESADSVISLLHQIRALGVQLAIDDFGTGYSSLSYLRRFPINTLKIDRSFIHKMSAGSDHAEIVRTIVTLAHNLNMDVTAEGVETAEQSAQLQNMRCETGQGFLFSKPVDGTIATQLLAADQDR